ncbi:MAG: TVP38/TMEM64 family protein, partial [Paracoccaceae bacterium]
RNRQNLITFRDENFGWTVVGFLSIYILIVSFSLPGASVTSITGGFLFGLVLGTVLNVLAASIGAIAIFLAVKIGLGKFVTQKIDQFGGRMTVLRERLLENEISVLLMLRLLPIVPFFAVNIIAALVGVRLKNFAFTTILGIIPGALVFTWIGVGIGDVFDQSATPDISLIWSPQVLGPLVGLALLLGVPALIRIFRPKEY